MKAKKAVTGLVLGALGVVFGDIGTSPLYAFKAIFGLHSDRFGVSEVNVTGVISLIIWTVVIVVSVKYIGFIMKVDNKGEGGILALVALIRNLAIGYKTKWIFIFLGLLGVALFYGDSAITPAISVMSAVEGLNVNFPETKSIVVPITLLIMVFLFGIQRFGTSIIGKIFGPVMLVWFLLIGFAGLVNIWHYPKILMALSPITSIDFIVHHTFLSFIAMGAVVLAITGAEALYADMGHFGRPAIARAWFLLVFPSLVLCYMGQGALILANPSAIHNPFILLFPSSLHIAVVVLATLATLIASQSVISGAFSLTHQAIQLDFLPKMNIKHTSETLKGQIYLPFINFLLFSLVIILVLVFQNSEKLASAYGMAVSGTLAIDTILLIVVAWFMHRWSRSIIGIILVLFGLLDIFLVLSNLPKILHGGWFSLILASLIFVVMTTWIKGEKIVGEKRKFLEGSLQEYVDNIQSKSSSLTKVPGQAVYITHHKDVAPLALRTTVEELKELHEKVIIVTVNIANEAHISPNNRVKFDDLEHKDGISQLTISYGYHDKSDIPKTLSMIKGINPEYDFDEKTVNYFISLSKIVISSARSMSWWRKIIYSLMFRNALSPSDYYNLPTERTIEMRSLIEI